MCGIWQRCCRSLPLIQILKCAADAQGDFSSQEHRTTIVYIKDLDCDKGQPLPPPPYSIPVLDRCFRRSSQHPSRPRRPSCQPPTPPHSPVIDWCCHRSGRYTSPSPSPAPAVLPPYFSFPRVFLLTWMIRGIVLLSCWRGVGPRAGGLSKTHYLAAALLALPPRRRSR